MVPVRPAHCILLLTAFFAEHKEELCGCLLHTHVHMCHKTNQFVPDSAANLWPDLHILQGGEYLKRQKMINILKCGIVFRDTDP